MISFILLPDWMNELTSGLGVGFWTLSVLGLPSLLFFIYLFITSLVRLFNRPEALILTDKELVYQFGFLMVKRVSIPTEHISLVMKDWIRPLDEAKEYSGLFFNFIKILIKIDDFFCTPPNKRWYYTQFHRLNILLDDDKLAVTMAKKIGYRSPLKIAHTGRTQSIYIKIEDIDFE